MRSNAEGRGGLGHAVPMPLAASPPRQPRCFRHARPNDLEPTKLRYNAPVRARPEVPAAQEIYTVIGYRALCGFRITRRVVALEPSPNIPPFVAVTHGRYYWSSSRLSSTPYLDATNAGGSILGRASPLRGRAGGAILEPLSAVRGSEKRGPHRRAEGRCKSGSPRQDILGQPTPGVI